MSAEPSTLVEELLGGSHAALARVITHIENRTPGYREIVGALYDHTGNAAVIGITGSPGSGKSTLVNRMAERYREQGLTVGVIGIDPSSPFTGGAVLGDRIRMASTSGDMDVFFRSMSARGSLGGLSTATADAVKALDAFGKDKIIVETVGAGQNEIDIVKTADTVCVLVPPGSGDDIQMLKAGILEIGDVFVVNKADLEGVDRTVRELQEMIEGRADRLTGREAAHHGSTMQATDPNTAESESDRAQPAASGNAGPNGDAQSMSTAGTDDAEAWTPRIVETVAKADEGVEDFLDVLDAHERFLAAGDRAERRARTRYTEEIRAVLREDANALIEREVATRGGFAALADQVLARESDPYSIAERVLEPFADHVATDPDEEGRTDPIGSDETDP